MRRRSSCIILLAGCNSILGLSPVKARDAAFYDTPTDAPFQCPVGSAPSFDHGALVQVLDQNCGLFSLNEDGTRALAQCDFVIVEGANDGTLLVPAPGLETTSDVRYGLPLLGPDGTLATVVRTNLDLTRNALLVTRDPDAWRVVATFTNPGGTINSISQPTRGPGAHLIVDMAFQGLHEFVDTGNGWEDRATLAFPDFVQRNNIELSPDGLHAWWTRNFQVYYANRTTLDDPLIEVGPVPGGIGLANAFISADCGGIYFGALDRIWKAPRI
jgi:hypothetical protein